MRIWDNENKAGGNVLKAVGKFEDLQTMFKLITMMSLKLVERTFCM